MLSTSVSQLTVHNVRVLLQSGFVFTFLHFSGTCCGRNLEQNSNNNLWGFGLNYEVTKSPISPSVSVTQHVDTHTRRK
jgi:hypothetical protein